MKYLITPGLLILLALSSSPLLAFGKLSAEEVRALFTGNTVEGERRKGLEPGQNPDMLGTYAEKYIAWFAGDGKVVRDMGGRRRTGKWRVMENGKHCIQWQGKQEKCAAIRKEGSIYKRTLKSKYGKILWEMTFTRFTPGNPHNL